MNDETKKEDYYREEWAKIQIKKHNEQKSVWQYIIMLYFSLIFVSIGGVVGAFGVHLVILIVNWILLYLG